MRAEILQRLLTLPTSDTNTAWTLLDTNGEELMARRPPGVRGWVRLQRARNLAHASLRFGMPTGALSDAISNVPGLACPSALVPALPPGGYLIGRGPDVAVGIVGAADCLADVEAWSELDE